jgi:hypothetical protein
MKGRRQRGKRTEHGTRKWILKVLESSNGAREISSSEIRKRIAKLSGAKIPDYSLYQALRTLVRQKLVQAHRVGREFSYQLVSGKQIARAPTTRPLTRAPFPKARPARPLLNPHAEAGRELHKLAMGDIVILKIGDTFVEVATNLNGRLVLERHPRPT